MVGEEILISGKWVMGDGLVVRVFVGMELLLAAQWMHDVEMSVFFILPVVHDECHR